jgi:putative ABC transport system permease protein
VLILCLSVFLFITAVSVINNNKNLYTKLHNQLNGAHQILQLQNGIYNPQEFHSWWSRQEGVTTSELMSYQTISKIATQNKKDIVNYIAYMMKTPQMLFAIDRLIMTDGIQRLTPSEGSIWIPTAFALANNVKAGDTMTFTDDNRTFTLTVEAIIIDISYCAPFSTNGRFWLNPQDYNRLFISSSNQSYMLSLRFTDYAQNRSYWERFEQDYHQPYLESITEFETLSSFYFVTNNLISFIMLFMAVLMLFIALFAIEHILSDSMLTNYRTIGVTRSLGFSSLKTVLTYMMQFTLLCLFAVIPGMLLSFFISRTLVMNTFQYLSSPQLAGQFRFFPYAVIIMIITPLFIALMTALFTKKAAKIQAVQAIRYGMDEKEASKMARRLANSNKNFFSLGTLPITISLALRSLTRNRRSTMIIGIVTVITISVLTFCSIFFTSISHIPDTVGEWGYNDTDAVIKSINSKKIDSVEFSKVMDADAAIRNYSYYTDVNAIIERTGDVPPMGLIVSIVAGNYDEIGYTNLEGRNPKNGNEITLGANLARTYHKALGDSVTFYIKGQKKTFIVTGIYQAIANMAYSARITSEAMAALPEPLTYDNVFINLNNPSDFVRFTEVFNQKFDGWLQSIPSRELAKGVISEAVSVLSLPIIIMEAVFLLVIFLLLYSIGSITIKKYQKTYGIYKSFGMPSGKIRCSIAMATFFTTFLAMWIGIAAGALLIPKLLNLVFVQYGIVHMPLYFKPFGIAGVDLAGVLCATLGSYAASRGIRKTSPRILIVE